MMRMHEIRYASRDAPIDVVVGVEARGFLVGAPLAYRLNVGLVLARKPGKLPGETVGVIYERESDHTTLEIHRDAIRSGAGAHCG
jgi:adenine phosphoribosyltransferase